MNINLSRAKDDKGNLCFVMIDQNEEAGIYFATNNDFMVNNADFIRYNNTFTVEVEEEITEDTPLSMIIECDEDSSFWMFEIQL